MCVKLATGHKSGLQGKHLLEVHGKRKPFEFQTHVAFQASWIMSGRLIVTIEAFFLENRGIYAEQVPYNKWMFYDFLIPTLWDVGSESHFDVGLEYPRVLSTTFWLQKKTVENFECQCLRQNFTKLQDIL